MTQNQKLHVKPSKIDIQIRGELIQSAKKRERKEKSSEEVYIEERTIFKNDGM
jgi:hypothetical protein